MNRNRFQAVRVIGEMIDGTTRSLRTDRKAAMIKIWDMYGGCKLVYDPSLKRAYYRPFKHTAYFYDQRSLVAEIAHCYQMKEWGFIKFAFMGIYSWAKKPFFSKKSYDKGQYTTEGTIEYHAHQVLEKKIWNEYLQELLHV